MFDQTAEIQTEVYNKASSSLTYNGAAVPIYSVAPMDPTYPYVVLTVEGNNESSQNQQEMSFDVELEIVSVFSVDAGGYHIVNNVGSSIMAKMLNVTSTTNINVTCCIFEASRRNLDFDGTNVVVKRTLTYRIDTQYKN